MPERLAGAIGFGILAFLSHWPSVLPLALGIGFRVGGD
jgi:hypothetical protein